VSPDPYEFIPGRFGLSLVRSEEGVIVSVPFTDDVRAEDGRMRPVAILMAIDMGAGLTAGLAVPPDWTVTADIETRFVSDCRVGPLQVASRSLKAGTTMSIVESRVTDGHGSLVALSTANHGVLSPDFEDEFRTLPVGGSKRFASPDAPGESLEHYFGLTVDDGRVSLPASVQTRNPWGIVHGGLVSLMVEVAAAHAGIESPTDVVVRYLSPVRQGPAVAEVVEVVERADDRLVRIQITDEGAGRVTSTAMVAGL